MFVNTHTHAKTMTEETVRKWSYECVPMQELYWQDISRVLGIVS